jgi:heptosyltransferase I
VSEVKEKTAPHVCIVLLTGLGDVVHGLPLVNAIRDANPNAPITWVAEPMPASFLSGHPSIDRLVVYNRSDGFRGVRQLRRDLKAGERVDLTLNLNVYLKSIWPTLLSGAPRRVGFDRQRSFEGVWLASNERLNPSPRVHTADMFLEFAKHLNIPVEEPEWRIDFSPDERREQEEFFRKFDGRPVATIIPATATIKKDWLPERWAHVATALERDFGFSVLVAGGPGEREQAAAQEIVTKSAAKVRWGMTDSVRKLAWTLAGSRLVLAADTGPVHIARALSVPVIGLYGHTNPWRVGPWKAYQDLWIDHYTDEGQEPDVSDRRPKWERMPTITVEEVLERVTRAVSDYHVTS